MIKITFTKQCTIGFLHNHQKWKCNRYMRDKNKPTGKEIQVILTKKLPGHNVLKKMVKNRNKNVHLPGSICSRWLNWTQINRNKLKTWLKKWFSQFQQVSVHGPDCSRSRVDWYSRAEPLSLVWISWESVPISPLWLDAMVLWHPRVL